MKLLQQEAELEEMVRLVGIESLSQPDRLILKTAKSIREDFLHQNAFHEVDTYTSMKKQFLLLKLILDTHQMCQQALETGATVEKLAQLPANEEVARAKYIAEDQMESIEAIREHMKTEIEDLVKKGEGEEDAGHAEGQKEEEVMSQNA
jgi:V/A-type H+-transporting ATPase subunit A